MKFNLPRYVINSLVAISYSYTSNLNSRTPGYRMMITKFYMENGIDFEDEPKIPLYYTWKLSWKGLMKKGIYWINGKALNENEFKALQSNI